MPPLSTIEIRDIEKSDIDSIVQYWLGSTDDYLVDMGVDLNKLPTEEQIRASLEHQIDTPKTEKSSHAMICVYNGQPVGHCNIVDITHGKEAQMHLHLWDPSARRKGIGSQMVKLSTTYFIKNFDLERIICEPYADNPAPHKTLLQSGFIFEKKYRTTPGYLCTEDQWVKRYILTA